MKLLNRLAIASLVSLALAPAAFSAQKPAAVAKLMTVDGKAFVETVAGNRKVAKQGMSIAEGDTMIVLEKSKVAMNYIQTDCKVTHGQNTLLTVQGSAQCAVGQPIAIGGGAGGLGLGGAGAGSLGAGAAAGAGSLGLGAAAALPAALAGLAGLGLLSAVIDNNSTSP